MKSMQMRLILEEAIQTAPLPGYSFVELSLGRGGMPARQGPCTQLPPPSATTSQSLQTQKDQAAPSRRAKDRSRRTAAALAVKPNASPNSAGRRPSNKTFRNTCSRCAPKASRIPISPCRCPTRYEGTPNKPTAASGRDTMANTTSKVASRLASTVLLPTIWSSVRMSPTARFGSISAMIF